MFRNKQEVAQVMIFVLGLWFTIMPFYVAAMNSLVQTPWNSGLDITVPMCLSFWVGFVSRAYFKTN